MSFLSKFLAKKSKKIKEQRLNLYEETMFQILENKETRNEKYELLLSLVMRYLTVYNNTEDIPFESAPWLPFEISGAYQFKESGREVVYWNPKYITHKNLYGNIEAFSSFFVAIAHELMHAKDKRDIEKTASKRDYAGFAKFGVDEYLRYRPKQKVYSKLSASVYLLDRSEVLARQASIKTFENFVKKFAEYLHKQNKQEDNAVLGMLYQALENKKSIEKTNMENAVYYNQKQLESFKKDIFKLSEDLLNGKVKLKSKDSLLKLSYTQASPNLYEEKTLQNFLRIANQQGYTDVEKECKSYKEKNEQYRKKQSRDFYVK